MSDNGGFYSDEEVAQAEAYATDLLKQKTGLDFVITSQQEHGSLQQKASFALSTLLPCISLGELIPSIESSIDIVAHSMAHDIGRSVKVMSQAMGMSVRDFVYWYISGDLGILDDSESEVKSGRE